MAEIAMEFATVPPGQARYHGAPWLNACLRRARQPLNYSPQISPPGPLPGTSRQSMIRPKKTFK
jgi:hypothetical protein